MLTNQNALAKRIQIWVCETGIAVVGVITRTLRWMSSGKYSTTRSACPLGESSGSFECKSILGIV